MKSNNLAKKAKLEEAKRKADQLKARAPATDSDDDGDDDATTKRVRTNDTEVTEVWPQSVQYDVLPTTMNQTVVGQVTEYVKTYFYRNNKFIQTDKQLDMACTYIWNELKAENHWSGPPYHLSSVRFGNLYGALVKNLLSEARQYGQTKGKNAAQGKYFCCLLRLTGCLLCLTGRVKPKPVHSHLAPASTI